MQARLLDINQRSGRYHFELLQQLNHGKYTNVIGSLYATNALLPDKFRLAISTKKYLEATREDLLIVCMYCETEHKRYGLKTHKRLLPTATQILTGKEDETVWSCPQCKKVNKLSTSKMKNEKIPQPTYFRIIPEPPRLNNTIADYANYRNKIEKWVWLVLHELEKAIADYREDYLKNNRTDGVDLNSETAPEENLLA